MAEMREADDRRVCTSEECATIGKCSVDTVNAALRHGGLRGTAPRGSRTGSAVNTDVVEWVRAGRPRDVDMPTLTAILAAIGWRHEPVSDKTTAGDQRIYDRRGQLVVTINNESGEWNPGECWAFLRGEGLIP